MQSPAAELETRLERKLERLETHLEALVVPQMTAEERRSLEPVADIPFGAKLAKERRSSVMFVPPPETIMANSRTSSPASARAGGGGATVDENTDRRSLGSCSDQPASRRSSGSFSENEAFSHATVNGGASSGAPNGIQGFFQQFITARGDDGPREC